MTDDMDELLKDAEIAGTVSIEKTDNPHDNAINIAEGFVRATFELVEYGNKQDEQRSHACLACVAEGLIGATMAKISDMDEKGEISDYSPMIGGLLNVHKQMAELIAHLANEHGKREGLAATKH